MPNIESKTVQASRDGHEFHEAWAARMALSLLVPNTELEKLSMEGFTVEDDVSAEASEIADLVKYYKEEGAEAVSKINVVQFKYFPTNPGGGLTASDLSKTLSKFVKTQSDFQNRYGSKWINENLCFEFTTNLPIGKNLESAFTCIREKVTPKGHVKTQYNTLCKALGLDDLSLERFLDRFEINGEGYSLSGVNQTTQNLLCSWQAPEDPMARVRFLELCKLVRNKAGLKGYQDNVIKRIDILGVLDVQECEQLYPVTHSFPKVSTVLERSCLAEIFNKVSQAQKPVLIHGSGGSGKTVIMQALTKRLEVSNVAILFDGFGGGQWRVPGDDRHQCRRSLVHIVNQLAAKGLCDLLLPNQEDLSILRVTRKRLKQAKETLSLKDKQAKIYLLLDAIDHAGMRAKDRHEDSFATLLIESLTLNPISGVSVVASCRSERREISVGQINLTEIQVPLFSFEETQKFLKQIDPKITDVEAHAIQARSFGNPRCIDVIFNEGRPFEIDIPISQTETDVSASVVLDELLKKRFNDVIESAIEKGSTKKHILNLFHGLALLPPPVPIVELASAYDLSEAEVESFFSDLYPLVENTKFGLIFRDEPTETLAIKLAKNNESSLEMIIVRMKQLQSESQYATRALPPLLLQHGKLAELVELAFSKEVPSALDSSVAIRGIRLSRLASAITGCAQNKRYNDLFKLSLEASYVSGGSERADRLVHDFPDLAAISGDSEALRRIFEDKSYWPGARFSTIAIVNQFTGDWAEADRSGGKAIDWLNWQVSQPRDRRQNHQSEDRDWIRSIFILLINSEQDKIIKWIDHKNPFSAYMFFCRVLDYLNRNALSDKKAQAARVNLIALSTDNKQMPVWFYAAVLRHLGCSDTQRKKAITNLSKQIEEISEDQSDHWKNRDSEELVDAFLWVANVSVHLGLKEEARKILDCAPVQRPDCYAYDESYFHRKSVSRWIIYSATRSILERRKISYFDILPNDIWTHVPQSTRRRGPKAVEVYCKKILEHNSNDRRKSKFNYEKKGRISRTISGRAQPIRVLMEICRDLTVGRGYYADFQKSIDTIINIVQKAGKYPHRDQDVFLTQNALLSVFNIADALRLWAPESSIQATKWIKDSPTRNYVNIIRVVDYFTSSKATHEAALDLVNWTAEQVKLDSEVEVRLQNLSRLSRAILPVSSSEAGILFVEALDFADAIGSDNYDQVSGLVGLLSRYNGEAFSSETVHNFTRVVELNLTEETEKFAWVSFSKSLANMSGFYGMAFLTRLADREKSTLGWSLTPYLSFLVEMGKLEASTASAIMGLDEVLETWDWRVTAFVKSIITKLDPQEEEYLLEWVCVELDRIYKGRYPDETLKSLIVLFSRLEGTSERYPLLLQMQMQLRKKSEPNYPLREMGASQNIEDAIVFDLSNVTDLDAKLVDEKQNDEHKHIDFRVLSKFINQASSIDENIKIIDTITNLAAPSLYDKLTAFEKINDNWGHRSKAVKAKIASSTVELADKHHNELIGGGWETSSSFGRMVKLSPDNTPVIATRLIIALRGHLDDLSSEDWLRCAHWLVDDISCEVFKTSVSTFVSELSSELPADFGDPPWDAKLFKEVPEEQFIAQFIWHQLGSPHARIRWRAAHAIRRLSKLGKFELIEDIFSQFQRDTSAIFGDKSLPFYHLHAKVWLLFTLDRISIDHPNELQNLVPGLQDILNSEGTHVLMHSTAFSILSRISTSLNNSGLNEYLKKKEILLTPIGFKSNENEFRRRDHYGGRPDGQKRPKYDVSLDYDFEKYEVNGLGRLFGVDTWEIRDKLSKQIRKYDNKVDSMHICPRRIFQDPYSSVSDRFHDRYGVYLANHGLLTVAGHYLRISSIIENTWEQDPWKDWLNGRSFLGNDLWISDSSDPFPIDLCEPDIVMDNSISTTKDKEALTTLIKSDSVDASPSALLVDAFWKDDDGTTFTVSSVFVKNGHTSNFVTALSLVDSNFQHIPDVDQDEKPTRRDLFQGIIFPWLEALDTHRERIDHTDPYAAHSSLDRPRPNEWAKKTLGINKSENLERVWLNQKGNTMLRSECWGGKYGSGRHGYAINGHRMFTPSEQAKTLLSSQSMDLVFLIKANKYVEGHGAREGQIYRKSVVVVVNKRGHIRPVLRISKKARDAYAQLSEYDQSELSKCFRAVSNAD